MKNSILFLLVLLLTGCKIVAPTKTAKNQLPEIYKGHFTDDYGITYSINDSVWIQHPDSRYHILSFNEKDNYIIAQNSVSNISEAGFYTRIDLTSFNNMEPYNWGFCLTVYSASSAKEAKKAKAADKQNPKKGCNGYPFSRMKRNGKL